MLGLAKKYGWGSLAFMVETGTGSNNIFRHVEKIHISDMHHQAHGYFGLIGIGNVVNQVLPKPLVLSDLQKFDASSQEVQKFYDKLRLDIIANAMEGSITKTYLQKIRLYREEYEWADAEGFISNYGPTMLYLLFKIINPATIIGISNLKCEI